MTAANALVEECTVVVCCGTGGVGKTTTAAAIALEAARRGRNACVVTIDPAKRLANALGLAELADTATEISHELWDPENLSTGKLSALMLDTKSTFDHLVTRYSTDPDQCARILSNRFYRNVSGALGGTQEYMAMEKLHELHTTGGFDFVVVDTPPTRHALDFIEAPGRLLQLLDNRLFGILMAPTRAYMKAASFAMQALLRTISRVVGRDVIDDVIAFFRAFEGMEQGFRERAVVVQALIAADSTSFVLVTTPRRDALAEAEFFALRLTDHALNVDALIVNRVHPSFTDTPTSAIVELAAAAVETNPALAERYRLLADMQAMSDHETKALREVHDLIPETPISLIPLLAADVHDLASLGEVADHLFGDPPTGASNVAH